MQTSRAKSCSAVALAVRMLSGAPMATEPRTGGGPIRILGAGQAQLHRGLTARVSPRPGSEDVSRTDPGSSDPAIEFGAPGRALGSMATGVATRTERAQQGRRRSLNAESPASDRIDRLLSHARSRRGERQCGPPLGHTSTKSKPPEVGK